MLYLGDAQAATHMFYDKDQEKKADRQSQVLKIPVTDFELSVRSRNCLQKMDIRTLGDLIMKTEQELLSYKNFGETSLEEIKVMLNQKGLRLGQGLEETAGDSSSARNPLEATANPEILDRSIDELDLSVRSRRCMERLGVRTVRELINKTEVELMAAKNFGMTSLNEIKRKLTELGLSLRG
jgi:DNA-directed RNA polymerase subunit alpha